MTPLRVRDAEAGDLALLAELLGDALARREAVPPSLEGVLAHPHLARFLEGWPLAGDAGVVGELGEPVGAAWYRRMSGRDDGFGFVSESVPVVTVGVRAALRGHGYGAELLRALAQRARTEGVEALSLGADTDHPAIAHYRALGFVQVGGHEGGITMLLDLDNLAG